MKKCKQILSVMLAAVMLVCAVPVIDVGAITFAQLNADNVFLKQAGSTTCTLCSATMMLRRYSMLRGDSDWSSITESSVRSVAWINGTGLRFSFSYSSSSIENINVGHGSLPGGSANGAAIQEQLKTCPEGIVIYYEGSNPHAVLLTDYTDGVYYCADPAGGYPSGRIPLSSAHTVTLTNVTAYWKVTSAVVPGPTDNPDKARIDINPNGGSAQSSFYVNFGDKCNLTTDSAWKPGYALAGWNLYRPADEKWFVGGEGWCTSSEISANGYSKKLYSPNLSMTLDSSWYSNCSTSVSVFTFFAVWQKVSPVIADDKNAVVIGEEITFRYYGLTECSKAEFCFEKNGEVYYRADSTSSTTFKTYFESAGIYYIFVRGLYNGEWYNSGKIKVSVLNPEIHDNKNTVCTGESISFTYSGLTLCSEVQLEFSKNGEVYYSPNATSSTTFTTYFENPGTYYVNAAGFLDDNWCRSGKIKVEVVNHSYGAWTKLNDTQHQRVCARNSSHVEKANHTWNSGTVTTAATCTTTGVKTYTCSVCSGTKTETIASLGHSFGAWTKLNDTQHQRVCARNSSHVEKANHTWNSGTVTTAATCTTTGVKTYTCSVCSGTKTESIASLGHSYGAWTKLNDTQHQRICSRNSSHVEKANHTWNSGTITKAATCSATGVKTYTCSVCNGTKTETISINPNIHINTTNVAATASTCTVKGYSAGVYCNDCKKYISGHAEQPLAAHQTTIINAKAASYDADGYTGDTYCTVCKQTISYGTVIPKLTKPDEPTNPTQPTEPTNPTQPTNPTTPTQPATQPTQPTTQQQGGGSDNGSSGSSMNIFQRLIAAIRAFFAMLFGR